MFFDILAKMYKLVLEAGGTANSTELVRFQPYTQIGAVADEVIALD